MPYEYLSLPRGLRGRVVQSEAVSADAWLPGSVGDWLRFVMAARATLTILVPLRQRLGADRVERGCRTDRLWIDLEMNDRGLARSLGGVEGVGELFGLLDRRAEPA